MTKDYRGCFFMKHGVLYLTGDLKDKMSTQ